jgi:hypothetical protein
MPIIYFQHLATRGAADCGEYREVAGAFGGTAIDKDRHSSGNSYRFFLLMRSKSRQVKNYHKQNHLRSRT